MRLTSCRRWITSFVLSALSLNAFADNLGVVGHTYPIEETDFLVFIENRLNTLQKTGELSALEKKWERGVKREIVRPKPVELTTLKTTHTFHYDPTFIADHDIFNTSGQLVVKKGTRVNPLEMFPLFHKTLVFYNDDNAKQRAFVQQYLKDHPDTFGETAVKPILTQGNIKKAAKALGGRPVYFDQSGKITHKLSIEHVPAIVTREGNQLLIVEVGEEELPHGQ